MIKRDNFWAIVGDAAKVVTATGAYIGLFEVDL